MRVKTGTTRRQGHKKVIKLAKGYRMTRSKLFKRANEAVLRAGQYAYIGRKMRKRSLRKLWIQRINAALSDQGISYSQFIKLLKTTKISLNRKILSDLAVSDPQTFEAIIKKVK